MAMARNLKKGPKNDPRSHFLKVTCPECSNELVVFSACSTTVKCNQCGAVVAQCTGGRARILGETVEILDRNA